MVVTHETELIGTSTRSCEAVDKVLGQTRYSYDFWMEGMLYAGVLRSPHPSARILAIATEEARQLPGVHAILTAQDIPGRKLYGGPAVIDHPVLASELVKFAGQAVALVAAESRELVAQALQLITVEYEVLEAIFSPEEALMAGAPCIGERDNLAWREYVKLGDVEQGFAAADVIVEQTYRTTWIEHAPLEVECGAVWPDEEGGLTVQISTQSLEYRQQIADVLALPLEKVRLVGSLVGGGFGRKLDITVELYIALLAWYTQRPVFLASTREESIQGYSKRHPFTMHYKTGATSDGRLTAMQIRIIADAGPFVYRSSLVSVHSLMLGTGPYYVPNADIDVQAIHTNNVFTSAMRAVGGPQVNFAYESQMDQLAQRLGMDPLELRRINYLRRGQSLPNGQQMNEAILLREAAEQAWQALDVEPKEASKAQGTKKIGRGISANFSGYGVPGNAAGCAIEISQQGDVTVAIGVSDLGGGQRATVAQIAADVLGVPLERVQLLMADTAKTPMVGATAGSKTLYYTSNATSLAAEALRVRLLEIAADLLEAQVQDLDLRHGRVKVRDQSGKGIELEKVLAEAHRRGIALSEQTTFKTPQEQKFDRTSGTGIDWLGFTYGAHAAEVEVDELTGEVTVRKYVCCHDVGRAIHPQNVIGQMQGGVAQGIGFTLTEQVVIENGIIQTPSLREYLVPTTIDIPDITTILLESGEGLGAFANRGIGEPPAAASAGAIANAIYDAIGVRITELPITPERVYLALQEQREQKSKEAL